MDALNSTNVTVVEGEDVNISCLASANPLPSDIVWTFGGDSTSFSQTDTTENRTAYVTSEGTFSFSEGNITSTLHITATEYPTNDGVYTCSSTSGTTTLSAWIAIEIIVQGAVHDNICFGLHFFTQFLLVSVTSSIYHSASTGCGSYTRSYWP